jgi:predicted sugar kinase
MNGRVHGAVSVADEVPAINVQNVPSERSAENAGVRTEHKANSELATGLSSFLDVSLQFIIWIGSIANS